MTREELLALRDGLTARLEDRKRLDDFDANARPIRELLDACLKLTQHLLDRMRRS